MRIVAINCMQGMLSCYSYSCTMLLKQIKGFYHGISKIFILVGSYTMLSLKDFYIVVHVRIDCGI